MMCLLRSDYLFKEPLLDPEELVLDFETLPVEVQSVIDTACQPVVVCELSTYYVNNTCFYQRGTILVTAIIEGLPSFTEVRSRSSGHRKLLLYYIL